MFASRRDGAVLTMTSHHSDILLPREAWSAAVQRSRLAAFVPILLALLGVAGVLLGGISAGPSVANQATTAPIDPVTTGSVVSQGAAHEALRLLDR